MLNHSPLSSKVAVELALCSSLSQELLSCQKLGFFQEKKNEMEMLSFDTILFYL